jgi:hypothetical protein
MFMVVCRQCREYIPGDAEEAGARCPNCRLPLFEPSDPPPARPQVLEEKQSACAVHPGNLAVGPCPRCGTFMCSYCRTRWLGRRICLACVERALQGKGENPEEAKAHRRQAILSLVFGLSGWILLALGSLPLLALTRAPASDQAQTLSTVAGLLLLTSLLPPLFGVGQASAALRARGDRMVLAAIGLLLSAAQLGVMLGLLVLNLWNN